MNKKNVIASCLSRESKLKLLDLGLDVLEFPENPALGENIANHSDLSFLFYGENTLFTAPRMKKYLDNFRNLNLDVVELPESLGSVYPNDVRLCAAVFPQFIILNEKTISPFLLDFFKSKNKYVIDVNQGYVKCSVTAVSDEALITDDESIYKSTVNLGLDVLKVEKGSVKLKGFEYGFIGGASGKISKNIIAFNGNIKKHKNYNEIMEFLGKRNVRAVSLNENELRDIGGILPLYDPF